MIHKLEISVVVPAYNEEKYVANCLQSLANQTFPKNSHEIIVVDNNSADKTRKIAEEFGARVIGCQVQGVAAARAAGVEAAYGEIIAGTDADTQVPPEWLAKIATHFQEDSNLVGLTGPTYLNDTGRLFSKFSFLSFDAFQKINFAAGKPTFSGFNFAVRKDAYEDCTSSKR